MATCLGNHARRIAGLCLLLLLAACGEPATEADRKALIGIWVPVEDMKPGLNVVQEGLVVIRDDGTFNFYERKDMIAQRNWKLTSKTSLELVSGNGIKTACNILVEGNTLTINDGDKRTCAAGDLDPLKKMKLKFVKAVDIKLGG